MKNTYEIRGDVTAIFLKRKDGVVLETLVNTCMLDKVQLVNCWNALWDRKTKGYRVQGRLNGRSVFLHRLIVGEPKGKVVDHKDHDTLNNTYTNLRVLTNAENMQNRSGLDAKNTSGYRGVVWHSKTQKWRAQIQVKGKPQHLGLFMNPEDATKVVQDARKKYMPYSED